MKLRVVVLMAFTFGLASFAATTPMDACKELVEKAKKDDWKGYTHMSGDKNPAKKGSADKFHAMHKASMEKIKNITCVKETIADDHAFVEAESQGKKRLIPFVLAGTEWKFNAGTYMAFYSNK